MTPPVGGGRLRLLSPEFIRGYLATALSFILVCEVSAMSITIHPDRQKQVIHSFGASDCWICQFVGKNWPIEKRNHIADLLFSMQTDAKGNPKGIGLSMWRTNIGAGSAEQGEDSRIHSTWHRAECYQRPDGSYDWTKQAGEQWFMEAARKRGVPYLLGFANSPPVHLTANGIAHSLDGKRSYNIRKGAMPKFADFLTEVAAHFKLDYISPANEPQHAWDNEKQEGTPATNEEIAELTRLLCKELNDRGLKTKTAIAEAGMIGSMSGPRGDSKCADQTKAFWDPSSPQYLGDVPNLARVLLAHSYFTTWPISEQIAEREKLAKRFAQIDPKLAYWQSEFCILEQNDEIGQGGRRDLGMDTALYVARVIHSDLTIANATHWSWWLGVTPSDFKDGLVYLDPLEGEDGPGKWTAMQKDGEVLSSKLLWAMGNFSRFVRPGMVRVDVTYDDNRSLEQAATSVMASAYLDKKTRELTIVLINTTKGPQPITLSGLETALSVNDDAFTTYTTSESTDLAKGSTKANAISLPARSVVTLVGRIR